MGIRRTAWHFFFGILLRKRGPRGIEVRDEVPLSEEPPRLDYLILRKTPVFEPTDPGATLRGLWPLLARVSAVELKSVGRPYTSGNLDRLWLYTHACCAAEPALLERRGELCAVLIVPSRTPTLEVDVERMGLVWESVSGGYWRVKGGIFTLYVVEIDVVADAEDDDLLRLFGHGKERTLEARRFWSEQVGSKEAKMAVHELEGYHDVMQKLLDALSPAERVAGLAPQDRVAGLAPQDRVAGLAPQDRVAGLTPEQVLLTMPDATLRALSDEYIATLSPPTQAAIRARCAK